jgi:glyoxylase-like metal-dependent hydrolase (beta-lactamase superfamily II)
MGNGVERVGLGAGNPEGENSAYVLPESRAVVDPGPPTDGAWDRLRGGLEDSGVALDDLEHVFVTHWHVDHAGLAPRLAEAADATVVMHEADAPLVADYAAERERRVERDARRLREWGVPDAVVDALQSGDRPSPMPASLPVEAVADGDEVGGVEVRHTPGHTLGHAAFVAGEETDHRETGEVKRDEVPTDEVEVDATLFVGDLVLPTYTPNVGGGDTRLEDALATYLKSLRRVERLADRVGVDRAAPGHGSTLVLGDRVDEIVAHHDERSRRTVAALDGVVAEQDGSDSASTATPWEVATRLFGEMDGIHAKMGAGEAASHLAFLRKRGAVERVESETGVSRYRVVDSAKTGVDG